MKALCHCCPDNPSACPYTNSHLPGETPEHSKFQTLSIFIQFDTCILIQSFHTVTCWSGWGLPPTEWVQSVQNSRDHGGSSSTSIPGSNEMVSYRRSDLLQKVQSLAFWVEQYHELWILNCMHPFLPRPHKADIVFQLELIFLNCHSISRSQRTRRVIVWTVTIVEVRGS